VPAAPTSLDAAARTEWDRVTALLHTQRVIAAVDLANLAVYCTLFSRLEAIRQATKKKSFRLLRRGKEHPLLRMERQTAGQLRPYLTELGLTPASRARVSPLPPLGGETPDRPASPVDDFDALEARLTGRKVVPIDNGRRSPTATKVR
jgi:P27 family predicted phage terminase small subunit